MTRVFFGLERTFDLCSTIAQRVEASGRIPDVIVGLATGGNFCAQRVAKALGVTTVIVLPVAKANGVRSLDPTVRLVGKYIAGKLVLGIDDTIISGKLLTDLRRQVRLRNGLYIPAALVGVGNYPSLPRLIVATELPEAPTFFWEDGLPD